MLILKTIENYQVLSQFISKNVGSLEPDIQDQILMPMPALTVQSLSDIRLSDPMNRSMPGLPVYYQLPESTQTHVHWVSDAIQPSHPLSSPSPPTPNPSQHQSFSSESTVRMRWPKYWSFSFSIIPSKEIPGLVFRMDWLDLLAVQGTLKESSKTPPKPSVLWLSFFCSPTLTSIHDYWENHSLD